MDDKSASSGRSSSSHSSSSTATRTKPPPPPSLELPKGASSSTSDARLPRHKRRQWQVLFEQLNQAVDSLYSTCLKENSTHQVDLVITEVENIAQDFRELRKNLDAQRAYDQGKQVPIVWEVRKNSVGSARALGEGTGSLLAKARTAAASSSSSSSSTTSSTSTQDEPSSSGEGSHHTGNSSASVPQPAASKTTKANKIDADRPWAMVVAGSQQASDLHSKLSSPERTRRSQDETRKRLEAKQAKAKLKRERLRHEQQHKRRKHTNKLRLANERKEQQRAQQMHHIDQKMEEADQRREQHIAKIKSKAENENSKVEELAFITTLNKQSKLASIEQKLKDSEARRMANMDSKLKKLAEDTQVREQKVEMAKRRHQRGNSVDSDAAAYDDPSTDAGSSSASSTGDKANRRWSDISPLKNYSSSKSPGSSPQASSTTASTNTNANTNTTHRRSRTHSSPMLSPSSANASSPDRPAHLPTSPASARKLDFGANASAQDASDVSGTISVTASSSSSSSSSTTSGKRAGKGGTTRRRRILTDDSDADSDDDVEQQQEQSVSLVLDSVSAEATDSRRPPRVEIHHTPSLGRRGSTPRRETQSASTNKKLMMLSPTYTLEHGLRRMCLVCNIEVPMDQKVDVHLQSKRHRTAVRRCREEQHQSSSSFSSFSSSSSSAAARGRSSSSDSVSSIGSATHDSITPAGDLLMDLHSIDCIITLPVSTMTVDTLRDGGHEQQLAYEEYVRSARKRAKKIRARMEGNKEWHEQYGNESERKLDAWQRRMRKLIDATVQSSHAVTDLFQVESLVDQMHTHLANTHASTDEHTRHLHYFRAVGGINAIMLVFANHDLLPSELVKRMIQVLRLACHLHDNARFLLMNNMLHVLMDLATAHVCLDETYLPDLLDLLSQCLGGGPDSTGDSHHDDRAYATMLNDASMYILSLGVADRIRVRFENSEGIDFFQQLGALPSPSPGVVRLPLAHTLSLDIVQSCLGLLDVLLAGQRGRDAGTDTAFHAMAQSKLAGIPVLMANAVLMAGPRRRRPKTEKVSFDPAVANVCLTSLRILDQMAQLDLDVFQQCMASNYASELYHVVSHLVWHCCSNAEQEHSPGLLHACTRLLGFYCLGARFNQEIMQTGQRPTLLQMLAGLPIEYFVDPKLAAVILPTLMVACHNNRRNCDVLRQDMSLILLQRYALTEHKRRHSSSNSGPAPSPVLALIDNDTLADMIEFFAKK